ncbi:BTB/POZ domain-containing protein 2-like [Sitodiplosis mosellana]|uniref:BTB/POZ domain-containing protein 2-like n=1 Tax=Sitodiplosis mosellana TaxID=263140 RepID=UPI0024446678|nr:BTB/POZ domain-containing protein 2-like [Sitodiplosis mosellana]XP_055307941.1 BTB/POZ domain-containing protein 2-like [Sitodiplosis mosellana]
MSVFNPLTSDYSTQLFAAIGKKLYMNSESADVHFVFEANDDYERVPVHKAHLMSGSDVFAKMFNGSWKEMDKVKIGDVSASAFKEFLQFFYFGRVKLTMENVAAVMNLGEMYNVTECLAACSKFLKNNISNENVCRNYELAILLNQEGLKKACETFIGVNIKAVFQSTDFQTCDRQMLAQILKLNWMSCTEVELFEACMSWVKVASKQDVLTKEIVQAHLGHLFHEIRFGSMSLQTFAALIPTYGCTFSLDEHQEIVQMFANVEFQPTIFGGNRVARCDSPIPWLENHDILCERLVSILWSSVPYRIKNLETTVFSTNETILLGGFSCCRVLKFLNNRYFALEGDVPTNITIAEVSDPNKKVIVSNANGILKSTENLRISLTKPIIVRPGFTYEIHLEQSPPENCYTSGLMKSMVELESGIIIQFHRDFVHVDDPIVARGSIYELLFKKI